LSKPQFSEFKAEGRRQEAEGKIRIFFPSALCPLPPAFFEMWLTELAIAVSLLTMCPFSVGNLERNADIFATFLGIVIPSGVPAR
jgi:hypothetical protein